MARKKKRGGSKRKHRRMGGASFTATLKKNEDILVLAGGVLVGGIAKGFIDQTLAKQDQIKINQNLVDGVEVAAGAAGALYLDHPFMKGFSIGVASAAALSGLRTAGVIKGVGALPMVPFRPRPKQAAINMNGASRTPAVAGGNVYGYPEAPSVGRSLRRKMASY